jgi:PTS system mannitol-specific IIC component
MNKLPLLNKKNIKLQQASVSKLEAIKASGELLLNEGYIEKEYIDSMIKRDENLTVYLGSSLAIPHGEYDGKQFIKQSGISILIYPNGIDWNGEEVKVVIGIAGLGDEHMKILAMIAEIFEDEANVEQLINATDVDLVYKLLT